MKCRLQFQDVTPNILILCSSHFILRLFTIPWAPVVALVIREYINKIQNIKNAEIQRHASSVANAVHIPYGYRAKSHAFGVQRS